MEYIRILTCKIMTTDEIWVRILIYNDCGTEKFLNVFFPVHSRVTPPQRAITGNPHDQQGDKWG